MRTWMQTLYAVVLAVLAWMTGEIVTFVMLGLILLSLHNIFTVLKEILRVLQKRNTTGVDEQQ